MYIGEITFGKYLGRSHFMSKIVLG